VSAGLQVVFAGLQVVFAGLQVVFAGLQVVFAGLRVEGTGPLVVSAGPHLVGAGPHLVGAGPHLVSAGALIVGSGIGAALVVFSGPLSPWEPRAVEDADVNFPLPFTKQVATTSQGDLKARVTSSTLAWGKSLLTTLAP
jgi:hypothetical protein